ncbi:hypothetical protein BOX15_Mlig010573g2 [Macrostomum lignano]|uniref:Uncharacterized protein n=1 Tax=Macrostomum lignano TaxID=282301 RepID=A0A267EQJ6_9PLAT|nr:hypothetical protein BOX15_Mlig010573g2 [Macrostomum lignano]
MESLDRRLSQLLKDNPDVLPATDDRAWWAYAEACVLSRRRLSWRLFQARRRARELPRICAIGLLRVSLLLVLLVAGVATARYHLRQTGGLEDAVLTASFHLRRVSVALGLHRLRYLQDAAVTEAPCLLPAPLPDWGAAAPNQSGAESCCLCSFEVRQSRLRNLTAAVANYRTVASRPQPKPFVLTNGGVAVSYAELRKVYLTHRASIESTGYNWVSRLADGHDYADLVVSGGLSELFADPSGPPAGAAIAWRVMHVEAVRQLRRLVPRPAFVAAEMEIGLLRQLVFLGSGWPAGREAPLRLPREMQNVHLTLLDGEPVVVTLSPRLGCGCPAGVRAVPLRPGELLFYRAACHQVGVARAGAAGSAPLPFSVLHVGCQL